MPTRRILISMWARQRLPDALRAHVWPSTTLLMQPSGKAGQIPFVRAATDARLWPPDSQTHIGRSVSENLHPIAVASVADICARHTSKPVKEFFAFANEEEAKRSHYLADWLLASASAQAGQFPSETQLSYLFASGAHRARAIGTMLRAIGKTAIPHMVDVGTGVGLIPWLLCNGTDGSQSVELFEPERKRQAMLERLWAFRQPHQTYTVGRLRAEEVQFSTSADVIMFCQCLFHIEKSQRQAVLERAWQALKPGGVLVLNERPGEASGREPLRESLLTSPEIVSVMPKTPQLFTARTGWRTAHAPGSVSANAIGYSGLFVSVKD